jgi:hypothetical protein
MNAALAGGVHKEEMLAGKPSCPQRHYRAVNRAIATDARQRHARHLADRRAVDTRRAGACPPSTSIEDAA